MCVTVMSTDTFPSVSVDMTMTHVYICIYISTKRIRDEILDKKNPRWGQRVWRGRFFQPKPLKKRAFLKQFRKSAFMSIDIIRYGVAMITRLLKNIGLFCRI